MDNPDTLGLNPRDIILGAIGLIMTLMTWIFGKQDKRLNDLEKGKVDCSVHESTFDQVIKRLDAQDVSARDRDLKLDRIIEKLIK